MRGLKRRGAAGVSETCLSAIVTAASASNGTCPVSISYSTTPTEYRSDAALTAWPCACSGREVLRGAHDRAGLGHVGRARTRDTEVRHLRVTGVVDDHVVGLQVAVDHAVAVGEPSGLEDLDREVDRSYRVDRGLLADHLLERPARDVLHRDVVGAIEGAAVVHADDVGVLEPGRCLRLTAEALDEPGVLGEAAVQQLQRHLATELLVLGQEHVGHPAAAEARDDPVAAVDQRPGLDFRPSSAPLRQQRLEHGLGDRRGDRAAKAALGLIDGHGDRDLRVLGRGERDERRLCQVRAVRADRGRPRLTGDADPRRAEPRCRSPPRLRWSSSASGPGRSSGSSPGE